MNITTYSTGTITIAANGIVATAASGSPLWASNVNEDDELVVTVGSAEYSTRIRTVTDDTHLAISKWPYGAVTGVAYTIYRKGVTRFNGAQNSIAINKMIADINTAGYIIPVPVGSDPDPSAGIELQYAESPDYRRWQRLSGVWTDASAGTSKAILISRDPSLANGSVSYTGVGFKPTSLIFNGEGAGLPLLGFADSSRAALSTSSYSAGAWTVGNNIVLYQDASKYITGTISSYDADGFTIAWVKTGSLTSTTFYVNVLCQR